MIQLKDVLLFLYIPLALSFPDWNWDDLYWILDLNFMFLKYIFHSKFASDSWEKYT